MRTAIPRILVFMVALFATCASAQTTYYSGPGICGANDNSAVLNCGYILIEDANHTVVGNMDFDLAAGYGAFHSFTGTSAALNGYFKIASFNADPVPPAAQLPSYPASVPDVRLTATIEGYAPFPGALISGISGGTIHLALSYYDVKGNCGRGCVPGVHAIALGLPVVSPIDVSN